MYTNFICYWITSLGLCCDSLKSKFLFATGRKDGDSYDSPKGSTAALERTVATDQIENRSNQGHRCGLLKSYRPDQWKRLQKIFMF